MPQNPFTPAPFRPTAPAIPDTLPETQLQMAEADHTNAALATRLDRRPTFLDRFSEEGRAAIGARRDTLAEVGAHRLRVTRIVHEVRETALRDYGNAVLRAQSTALEMEVQRVLLARYAELREAVEAHSHRFHAWLAEAYEALEGGELPPNVLKSRTYEIEAHLAEYHNVMAAVRSRFTELSSARV